jgi:acetyl-CoA C-acetyltransferase
MNEVFIIDGVRTAIGKFGGSLASMPAVDLGATITRALLKRTGIEAADVDEVLLGCVFQAGLGQNVARQVAMKSGLPTWATAPSSTP